MAAQRVERTRVEEGKRRQRGYEHEHEHEHEGEDCDCRRIPVTDLRFDPSTWSPTRTREETQAYLIEYANMRLSEARINLQAAEDENDRLKLMNTFLRTERDRLLALIRNRPGSKEEQDSVLENML